jgi:hypothetical protein
MSMMIFMSPEHVARMNELLAVDTASKTACAALDRRWNVVYELSEGTGTVWWTMRFDPAEGVTFNLLPPESPADVLFRGDHRAVLDVMRRLKAGDKEATLPLTQSGDPNGMAAIGAAYQAAHAAAALHTEIP